MDKLNFDDVLDRYGAVFRGAYEKANIWEWTEELSRPRQLDVLDEELDEMVVASKACTCIGTVSKDEIVLNELRGRVLTTICEALQVIAVLDKMDKHRERGVSDE